jgi:GR25 family glycosyltransferase involved in LPS biosynthesis
MEQIDVVFYINLEHRTDRKEHFLSEIKKLCLDETRIVRIDAVRNGVGIIGCTESHIKAMEIFDQNPEWKTCIIFEDDFTFASADLERNNAHIRLAMMEFPDWDVISLAYNHESDFITKDTHEPYVKRIVQHQTTSGYALTKQFMPTLAANFSESLQAVRTHGVRHELCFDIYWRSIQSKANWYCVSPALGYQYGSYSDIQNQFTDYKC